MQIEHTCATCRNTTQESYEVFERNNPRALRKFTTICNYCARKKLLQSEWVAMKVRAYKGLLGPIGRSWAALMAGIEFEKVWTSTGEFGVKRDMKTHAVVNDDQHAIMVSNSIPHWWEPLPKTMDQISSEVIADLERKKIHDEVSKMITHQTLLQKILELSHNPERAAKAFGHHDVIWDGKFIRYSIEKYMKARYYIDNIEVPSAKLELELAHTQNQLEFDALVLVIVNGVWTAKAQFVGQPTPVGEIWHLPTAGSMEGAQYKGTHNGQQGNDAPEPNDPPPMDLLDLNYPAESAAATELRDLTSLMTTAIDGAGGRDYTAILTYKRAGDLATADVTIEVLSVDTITQNIEAQPFDIEGLAKSHVRSSGVGESGGIPGTAAQGDDNSEPVDVGYGSEFDRAMDAVYDVVATQQLAELSPDLLRGPEWNRFYAACKAMRRANDNAGKGDA